MDPWTDSDFGIEKEAKMKKQVKVVEPKRARPVLAELVMAVCKEYADDTTAPSVVVSYVSKGPRQGYYASILRYGHAFAEGKRVVCNVSGHASTLEALEALAREWLGASAAKDALRAALA